MRLTFRSRDRDWHRWYAWRPVEFSYGQWSRTWAWLEPVARRKRNIQGWNVTDYMPIEASEDNNASGS